MDFTLTEEQQLLKDSVTRFLGDTYDFAARTTILATPEGQSAAVWAGFADLGLLGLPFSETDGGFGGGAVEIMLVMEAMGRALVVEPYLAEIVLTGAILRHAASVEQRAALIPALAAGECRMAFAHADPEARWHLAHVGTHAARVRGGYKITGEKVHVPFGAQAHRLIVSARTSGLIGARTGIGLFLVEADAPGVTRIEHRTQDGARIADITLSDVFVPDEAVLGDTAGALPAIERAYDEVIAALASEAFGVMDEAVSMTVEYLKTRQQFGVAIGSFQALQHRAAEMFVVLEEARSMAAYATMALSETDAAARSCAISAVKAHIACAARFIGQQAIQLHGGIGVTMEYKVGHLFKRLTVIEQQFGDRDHHLDLLANAESLLESL
ncbi:MAG: pimeloyl-CoA dehydrogenase small subunit [Rhizobiales bacterium PAR1]|nr:MAG: pimeloyl-CoA dehydrogenase small subunit [Rhizobiales bacterium PAR1]